MLAGLLLPVAAPPSIKLAVLNLDPQSVLTAGLGDAGDFAHQFHIAFSATVSGACVFSGQPFNCATSGFAGDSQSWHDKINALGGSASSANDHCKSDPDVVDVGSLVDYPRRHCGQNPVSVPECFDDVNYVKRSRVFLFRGTHDTISKVGAIENVDGLLAQMITDPQKSIKVVRDQAFGHTVPLRSTPHVGHSEPAGYDGPGECLRHVFDSPAMRSESAKPANWLSFDQTEFADERGAVGFERLGWIYVPERCQDLNGQGPGASPCKLVLRPSKCSPAADPISEEMKAWAEYGEGSGIVILYPCVGGHVDTATFMHAPDVVAGKLDVYGQLDRNYVQQSAPHMRVIGKMLQRILGKAATAAPSPAVVVRATPPPHTSHRPKAHTGPVRKAGPVSGLPALGIDRGGVMTAGCSNTADFAHQFHVAFSSIVSGSCIFSGMPYHCAVTRFPNDYMVSKSRSTAAGIHCDGCDANGTLTYDHCKNHPLNVDVGLLASYAESPPAGHLIDDPKVRLVNYLHLLRRHLLSDYTYYHHTSTVTTFTITTLTITTLTITTLTITTLTITTYYTSLTVTSLTVTTLTVTR